MVYCLFVHSLKLIVYPKPICSIIDLSTPAQNLILYTCTSLLFTPIPLFRGEEKALLQFQQGSGSVTSYIYVFFQEVADMLFYLASLYTDYMQDIRLPCMVALYSTLITLIISSFRY